jgi:hypothetical protein
LAGFAIIIMSNIDKITANTYKHASAIPLARGFESFWPWYFSGVLGVVVATGFGCFLME